MCKLRSCSAGIEPWLLILLILPLSFLGQNQASIAACNQENFAFIGNLESMKFHLRSCEFARIMARKRRVYFEDRQKASFAGMSACCWCLPKYVKTVEARLLITEP